MGSTEVLIYKISLIRHFLLMPSTIRTSRGSRLATWQQNLSCRNFNDFTVQTFTQSTTQSTSDAKIFLVLQATLISTSILSRYLSRSPSPFRRSWYSCHPLSKPCILDSFVFPFCIQKLNITNAVIVLLPDRPQAQLTILSLSRFSDALTTRYYLDPQWSISPRRRRVLQLRFYGASL